MIDFVNPFSRERQNGFSARVSEVKAWTRTTLSLEEDAIVSVNELACSQPGCPPKQVVILILRDSTPAWKFEVHKSLLDITQDDIVDAISSIGPGQSPTDSEKDSFQGHGTESAEQNLNQG